MEGLKLNEFIDNLYYGFEMVFTYFNRKFIIQGDTEDNTYFIRLDEIPFENNDSDLDEYYSISFSGISFEDCVNNLLKSKLIDNKDLFELEKNIKVIYG